jgi:hypothetical protein
MFGAVDAALRISVIDASIVPNATSAFTHIPTIMLAERLTERFDSASRRLRCCAPLQRPVTANQALPLGAVAITIGATHGCGSVAADRYSRRRPGWWQESCVS